MEFFLLELLTEALPCVDDIAFSSRKAADLAGRIRKALDGCGAAISGEGTFANSIMFGKPTFGLGTQDEISREGEKLREAGCVLIKRELDDDCGCPEEMWDTPWGELHMHLSAGKLSNACLDNGDEGERNIELTTATVDEARSAIFGWAQHIAALTTPDAAPAGTIAFCGKEVMVNGQRICDAASDADAQLISAALRALDSSTGLAAMRENITALHDK